MATPYLINRRPGVIDMAITSRPGVGAYRVVAATTLTAAQALTPASPALFDVSRDRSFRSPTLVTSSLDHVEDSRRGQTRIQVNMDDYASASVPGDGLVCFFRIIEVDQSGAALNIGPVFVVPPPGFYSSQYRTLPLSSSAPDVAGIASQVPPTGSLVISFPVHVDNLMIYNDDSVGTNSLYVALGEGQPEIEVPYNVNSLPSLVLAHAGTSVYLRGDGGAVPFRMTADLISGLR